MARHWTDETDREAIEFFDTLSTPEIRERQRLCEIQKEMAWEQGNDDALADLERMWWALFDAMMRRSCERLGTTYVP